MTAIEVVLVIIGLAGAAFAVYWLLDAKIWTREAPKETGDNDDMTLKE